jgi:carbamate kinase
MNKSEEKQTLLIALGGNALIKKGQTGTAQEQLENLRLPMDMIAQLSKEYKVIITHGNGPQVGNLLLQQESCDEVPKMPLEVIGAMTQGQIGYMIEATLDSSFMALGINDKYFVTLLTYTVVDENDPLFQNPSKPVGPAFSKEEAEKLPYTMVETAKGYRRVVASPKPVDIVQHREIKKLLDEDFIVICCGGGGIPVVRRDRRFDGVEAVIDKDLASSKLAEEVKADIFLIATDVQGAAINHGTKEETFLDQISVSELEKYFEQGQFTTGSMGPKVEAAINFVRNTGKRANITRLQDIVKAVLGKAGTEVQSA